VVSSALENRENADVSVTVIVYFHFRILLHP
jgi:hypothetical protein